ncbi:TetR/AcrR family transcriptional regulator [Nesterenkonia natronophila]|uniref:TetR family transcriptional regulator n=1 Tax=Nesterenkonia natronophila TaxID=2174932 RepID=A0A3A4F2F5_9MICC|nr:TetR family transcriptional regulator [Nesterenkonia natronophila]RJN32233.1 TetR family transcriptional regulator [Nesterenkonia natronophila]
MSDRTARARIRNAAISCLATTGLSVADIEDIAEDAGTSAALIIHHFGSKGRLRVVRETFRCHDQRATAAFQFLANGVFDAGVVKMASDA